MFKRVLAFSASCLCLFLIGICFPVNAKTAAIAGDETAAKAFGAVKTPSRGAADSIGFYSKGCLAGAEKMPLQSAHWQILHPQRHRYWGNPVMIAFLQSLADKGAKHGWGGLLIGDIAQPRGGPLPFGHASHQIGLDADIWLTPEPKSGLSLSARQNMQGGSVLYNNSLELDPQKWSKSHTELLKLAAEDSRTDRIFVHPGIKKYLCQTVKGDNAWLAKIRPYWGHYEHFHVRLKCPQGDKACQSQTPPPKGIGCDSSLNWWFSPQAWEKPKKPAPGLKSKAKQPLTVSQMPKPCQILLEQ